MELKSLTPLAEFVDAVYTRAAIELTPIAGLRWWVELRPPMHPDDGTGNCLLKGIVHNLNLIIWPCKFDAVTQGVSVPVEEMTIVADHHIASFKSMAEAHA